MNCRHVVNLISAYVDGELTGAEMLEIRRHLGECSECMEEYESLKMTKLAVARLRTVAPPRDLAACIVQKLDEVSIPPYQRVLTKVFSFTARKLSPVTAALAVSGLALAFLAAGVQDGIVIAKPDVVATAPSSSSIHGVSLVPQVPESTIVYARPRPLVVANYSGGATFQLANLSTE